MSYQDDLDWLARNVHEWPAGEHQSWCYVGRDYLSGDMRAAGHTIRMVQPGLVCRDDWLARRAELQNKPSWEDAPEAANYMAQEPYGMWTFFVDQPFVPSNLHNDGWRFEGFQAWSADRRGEVIGDWRETLEQRPADLTIQQAGGAA